VQTLFALEQGRDLLGTYAPRVLFNYLQPAGAPRNRFAELLYRPRDMPLFQNLVGGFLRVWDNLLHLDLVSPSPGSHHPEAAFVA
jgi:hypothetical protein